MAVLHAVDLEADRRGQRLQERLELPKLAPAERQWLGLVVADHGIGCLVVVREHVSE